MSLLSISNVQRLKNHWLSHDVKFNAGVSEASLAAFEAEFNVLLPSDLRDYFLAMNGMPDEVTDDDLNRFWMLEELTTLPTGAPDYARENYIDNPESLFLFADYSIWAHAYAIRLGSVSLQSHEVVIIGYKSPVTIAQSFSEFVDLYLTDNDRLH
jgi:hypothetical protein